MAISRSGYPEIMIHSQSYGSQTHIQYDTIDLTSPNFARKIAQQEMLILARTAEMDGY